MRRKKLLPKPEPPPQGCMFWYGQTVTIPHFEAMVRNFYENTRDKFPDWRNDPTYYMKINKRRKQDAV